MNEPAEIAYRQAERRLWQHVGLNPREQWIRVDGVRCRVQVTGEGPAVVLIHGAPNAGASWAPLLPYLTGYTCYVVDRPGTGLSEDYVVREDLEGHARRFVPQVLDGLGLDRAHVVASSFGGLLANMSVASAPDRVVRMVQMSCPSFAPGMTSPVFFRAMALRPTRRLIARVPFTRGVVRLVLRQVGQRTALKKNRVPRCFIEWGVSLQRHTNTARNDAGMIGSMMSLQGVRPESLVPKEVFQGGGVPTLFLWGEQDAFGGEDVARRVIRRMPDAELQVLRESGHLPWLDDPEGVGKATAGFLR